MGRPAFEQGSDNYREIDPSTVPAVAILDMWWFLLTSVRYSLGRLSYAAGMTADLVRKYRSYLQDHQVKQIAREVREYTQQFPTGHPYSDIDATWNELANELDPLE